MAGEGPIEQVPLLRVVLQSLPTLYWIQCRPANLPVPAQDGIGLPVFKVLQESVLILRILALPNAMAGDKYAFLIRHPLLWASQSS